MILNTVPKSVSRNVWQYTSRFVSNDKTVAEKVAAMAPSEMVRNMINLTNWNKRLLVFSGRYKSMAEVPDILPFATVDNARSKVRIKVANYMMVVTVFACIGMVYMGKKEAQEGKSVEKMNLDWHKEYNEMTKKEAEEAAKK